MFVFGNFIIETVEKTMKISSVKAIKKCAAVLLAVASVFSLNGCSPKKEDVRLSVWCAEKHKELVREMVDEFSEKYADEAQFNITISTEGEISCKQTVLSDPKNAADLYSFASDQFHDLYNGGALLQITENVDEIIKGNGGKNSNAIKSASEDGKLYAYPMTSGNGYFMYYNSDYFSEDDVKSFDKMLDIAAKNGKKVAMDFTSGWYIYSFFKAAGFNLSLSDDRSFNICNWNGKNDKYSGVDVSQAMLDIVNNPGFICCSDEEFVKGVQNGTIIAGVNGTWNSIYVKEAFGDGYAAAKLPTYTIAGNQEQMGSFVSYKLIGVNAYTENPKWAMRLADWLTNEENQLKRFNLSGECPSNVKAAASPDVQASVAISAEQAQTKYGTIQDVADQFWKPTNLFGTTIAAGNIDNEDLQSLLDTMVNGITSTTSTSNE